jgi:hypothetical protein
VTDGAAGTLSAEVVVAAVEVACFEAPQAATARTVRTAMTALFIGLR